jgi:predicted nucleic acid-binding protein
MLESLRRVRASEYRAFLATVMAVPVIHVSLRVFDFRRVQAWLERHPGRRATSSTSEREIIRDAVRALSRARRYGVYRGNCLSQSLALRWRLRRRGIATDLRLGANMADGTFTAHAWVEHAGVVLNDTQDVATRYAPLVPQGGGKRG